LKRTMRMRRKIRRRTRKKRKRRMLVRGMSQYIEFILN